MTGCLTPLRQLADLAEEGVINVKLANLVNSKFKSRHNPKEKDIFSVFRWFKRVVGHLG